MMASLKNRVSLARDVNETAPALAPALEPTNATRDVLP